MSVRRKNKGARNANFFKENIKYLLTDIAFSSCPVVIAIALSTFNIKLSIL
jgi:hypothetical protein